MLGFAIVTVNCIIMMYVSLRMVSVNLVIITYRQAKGINCTQQMSHGHGRQQQRPESAVVAVALHVSKLYKSHNVQKLEKNVFSLSGIKQIDHFGNKAQELCESRGGCPGSCQVKNNNNKTSFHRKLPDKNLICFHRKLPGKNLICFHRKLPGKNLICFHTKLPWGGDRLLHPYKQTPFSPFSGVVSFHNTGNYFSFRFLVLVFLYACLSFRGKATFVESTYLVHTCMPGGGYCRRLRSLLSCLVLYT